MLKFGADKLENARKSAVRRYNKVMDDSRDEIEPFEEGFAPRKRMKLKSWLILIFLPVALLLPSFAEFIRVGVVGREVVCCDSDNRAELEAQAERARENRQLADIIMKIGLFGGMGLAVLVGVAFLVRVVRFLPGVLKVVFGLAIIAAAGYVGYATYRMWEYYSQNTDEYYRTDAWYGFRDLEWYLPMNWLPTKLENKAKEENA